jgi:hypothetical protein
VTCKTYLPSILQFSVAKPTPMGRQPEPIDLKSEYKASWKITRSMLFGDACAAIALTGQTMLEQAIKGIDISGSGIRGGNLSDP